MDGGPAESAQRSSKLDGLVRSAPTLDPINQVTVDGLVLLVVTWVGNEYAMVRGRAETTPEGH